MEDTSFLGNLLHAQLLYCKYPGMKLGNLDAATCRTLVHIKYRSHWFIFCVGFCQNRPSYFNFYPNMASVAILIFLRDISPTICIFALTLKMELLFQQAHITCMDNKQWLPTWSSKKLQLEMVDSLVYKTASKVSCLVCWQMNLKLNRRQDVVN